MDDIWVNYSDLTVLPHWKSCFFLDRGDHPIFMALKHSREWTIFIICPEDQKWEAIYCWICIPLTLSFCWVCEPFFNRLMEEIWGNSCYESTDSWRLQITFYQVKMSHGKLDLPPCSSKLSLEVPSFLGAPKFDKFPVNQWITHHQPPLVAWHPNYSNHVIPSCVCL